MHATAAAVAAASKLRAMAMIYTGHVELKRSGLKSMPGGNPKPGYATKAMLIHIRFPETHTFHLFQSNCI